MTLQIANITNIPVSVIASPENQGVAIQSFLNSGEAIDGGNLTIKTKTLTYSNLNDYDNSSSGSIGLNFSMPFGYGGDSSGAGFKGDLKYTTVGLTYAANSSNQTGETKATIGQGTINLNSTITRDVTTGEVTSITGSETLAENDARISGLNRDVNNNQITNQTQYEGGYNINLSISPGMIADAKELYDNNLLGATAKQNLGGTAKLYGEALQEGREFAEDNFGVVGTVLTQPTSVIEGTIFSFAEDQSFVYKKTDDIYLALGINSPQDESSNISGLKLEVDLSKLDGGYYSYNSESNSQNQFASNSSVASAMSNFLNQYSDNLSNLYFYNKVEASSGKGYGLNGIMTSFETGFNNYQLRNEDVVWRFNPTHGFMGDLMESGLGKAADWTNQEQVIVMNRYSVQDIFDRRGIEDAINLYHSQGTIIGDGAMELYSRTFQLGYDLDGNLLMNADGSLAGAQFVNQSQKFVAVGPAVLEEDWRSSIGSIGLNPEGKINVGYDHDPFDSIRYLTAPTNLISDITYAATLGKVDFNSTIYIPNPISPIVGVAVLPLIQHHDVTNPKYMGEAFKDFRNQDKPKDNLNKITEDLLSQLNRVRQ